MLHNYEMYVFRQIFPKNITLLQATEVNHLNEEIKKLKEEIEKLQAVNSEREEKQKIIDELRKMVMEADTSKKSKLRSSYLALHYDSNSSEIKQLRAEVRTLKYENENLKTENLMLKKSENLKKLQKLREEQTVNATAIEVKSVDGDERESVSKGQSASMFATHVPSRNAQARKYEMDRQTSFIYQEKSFVRASTEALNQVEKDTEISGRASRPKNNEKEKEVQDLDFKFSENAQSVSQGHKRSPSKDRANKRVTFLSDLAKQYHEHYGDSADPPVASSADTAVKAGGAKPLTNGYASPSGKASENTKTNGPTAILKAEKQPTPSRGRPKQSSLKTRANQKRSVSLNSISSSRDLMKMSSQLIQKSRTLRQPTGH